MGRKPYEQKLVAILYADVAEYSRLTGEDESGTHRTLSTYLDLFAKAIKRYHGNVVHYAGDAVLAEFGMVSDALTCAINVQHELKQRGKELPEERQVRFRVGVNLGEVIVDRDDIYGEGVNIAARLESLAEPGGVCVSEAVRNAVGGKLQLDFVSMGAQQVKNIKEPVRAYHARLAHGAEPPRPSALRRSQFTWHRLAGGAAVVALIVGGSVASLKLWESSAQRALPLPGKPSIAVLPFANMSDDSEQEYFSDGITEDIITDLSKLSGLFVIARNSTFTYKGKTVEIRRVAKELGVRYVLEGSVRRARDRVRINAQLIDSATGGHVWTERFDGSIADVFALQDRVTLRVVAALSLKLSPGDDHTRGLSRTTDVDAYDQYLRGWEHYRKRTPTHFAKALAYFKHAVELDPNYAQAHAAIAWIYWNSAYLEWSTVLGLGLDQSKQLAREAVEKAMKKPTPLAHQVLSQIRLREYSHDEAISEAQKSLQMDPNSSDGNYALAEALIMAGKPVEAHPFLDLALRLDPSSQDYYSFLWGIAEFGAENFNAAADSFLRAIELNPNYWNPDPAIGWCKICELLISTYGQLGRKEDAKKMIGRVRQDWPTIRALSALYWWPFKREVDRKRFTDGLVLAGLAY